MNEVKTPTINKLQIIISFLFLGLLFSILGGIGWVIYYGLSQLTNKEIIPLLTAVIPTVAAIITAGATIYVAIKTKKAERLKEIEQELRKQKAPIYEEFSDFLLNKVLKNQASNEEMLEFIIKFNQKMIVFGDDKVIRSWVNFRNAVQNEEFQYDVLFKIEKVLFAIRSDMGHSNKELKEGDLLTLFINDMHNVMGAKQNNHPKLYDKNNPTEMELSIND